MPTYLNENDYAVNIGIPSLYLAADSSTITDRYIAGTLPSGVSLSAHTPTTKPWVLLAADDDTDLFDVASWENIVVFNSGADLLVVSANGDDTDAISVLPYCKEVWDNSGGTIGCLEILSGTGSIWGSMSIIKTSVASVAAISQG